MGAFARIRTVLGLVALAATFALASPGVKVVRAEDGARSHGPSQCSQTASVSTDADTQAFLAELRRIHGGRP